MFLIPWGVVFVLLGIVGFHYQAILNIVYGMYAYQQSLSGPQSFFFYLTWVGLCLLCTGLVYFAMQVLRKAGK